MRQRHIGEAVIESPPKSDWSLGHAPPLQKIHQNPFVTFGDILFTNNDYTHTHMPSNYTAYKWLKHILTSKRHSKLYIISTTFHCSVMRKHRTNRHEQGDRVQRVMAPPCDVDLGVT